MEIGEYEPRVVEKGVEETSLNVEEGGTYWIVQLVDSQFDCATQEQAEILSRLVRIEQKLDKLQG